MNTEKIYCRICRKVIPTWMWKEIAESVYTPDKETALCWTCQSKSMGRR